MLRRTLSTCIVLIAALLAGCANLTGTGEKPNANGYLVLGVNAGSGAAEVYTSMIKRGALSKAKGAVLDGQLDQFEATMIAWRTALIGCAESCDAADLYRKQARELLLELEKKLREEQAAAAPQAKAAVKARDAAVGTRAAGESRAAAQSWLSIIAALNSALDLFDAWTRFQQGAQGMSQATELDVDAAFARFSAARDALRAVLN